MNPRVWRLFVLLALAGVTWLLLAQFVRLSFGHGNDALSHGGAAFAGYLLTIGYAVYYRTYWAEPRVVTGREFSPMARWGLTMVVVVVVGVTLGIAFPDVTTTFEGLLFVQTITFGGVGVGLVVTMSRPPTATASDVRVPDPAFPGSAPPTFATSTLRVGAWQVYGFVGAAMLFGPIYLVMKGFESYVDIPACERACADHGYTYHSLVTGKSTYNCNCQAADGRHTFHDRAHIGGGDGALSAVVDWFVRTAAVFGALGAWLALLFGSVYWLGRHRPDGVAARMYRACTRFMVPKESQAAPPRDPKPRKVKSRSRRRG